MNAQARASELRHNAVLLTANPGTITAMSAIEFLGVSVAYFYDIVKRHGVHPRVQTSHMTLYAVEDLQRARTAEMALQDERRLTILAAHQAREDAQRDPSQYLAHCGAWHRIDALPFMCPTCQRVYFAEGATI